MRTHILDKYNMVDYDIFDKDTEIEIQLIQRRNFTNIYAHNLFITQCKMVIEEIEDAMNVAIDYNIEERKNIQYIYVQKE